MDRCAGARLAEWLRIDGHDVVEARELGPNPGDRALLEEFTDDSPVTSLDTDNPTSPVWIEDTKFGVSTNDNLHVGLYFPELRFLVEFVREV